MTLIACTLNHKVPFILGDLLISSDQIEGSVPLPTSNNDITPHLFAGNSLRPIGLNQKIYILKDNVCIALAGKVIEMERFLIEFKLRCSYFDPVKENDIRAFIEGYNFIEEFSESAFFILLIEQGENNSFWVKQFWYPENEVWDFTENEIFEGAYAAGSGKQSFLNQLNANVKYKTSAGRGDVLQAIALNIGLIARLLAAELVSLFTIQKNWGRGLRNHILRRPVLCKV